MIEMENYRPYIGLLTEKCGDREEIPLLSVAAFMGVDHRTLRGRKGFPVRKIGGRYVCRRLELAKYLARRE